MALSGVMAVRAASPRSVVTLHEGWEFSRGEAAADTPWQPVRVPHDWAIYGPFSRENDLQEVAVEQNGEQVATVKTGRTGGLPFLGKGSYRTILSIPDTAARSHVLLFDGAMSNARVMAEALGLGCCCIGYVRTAAPQEVSTLLHLPQGSFIVCGLAIGYPREQPDMKPKQNEPLLIHHNRYHDEDIVPLLQQYDETISVYNRTRQGGTTENDWCGHIVGYYEEGMDNRVLNYLQSQGCGIEHEND